METTPRQAPPVRCAPLAELVESAGGHWVKTRCEGEVIEYAVPEQAETEVRDYLSGRARVTAPARGLACMPAARVCGTGVVLSVDGRVIARDVSEDFGKGTDEHWLIGYEGLRAPVELAGETAVVAVNRGAGYCHWLLEELPRLLALPKGTVVQVIAHAGAEPMRAAWARRGGTEKLIEARRSTHVAVGPLWVPGLVAEAGAPTPEAVRAVREFAEALGRAATERGGAGELIYVSRARAARRKVTNEDELWRALEAEGFARVFLENLSWEEQIAVARAARVIVAPHGAGLANLVFCAPGTRVVELVNRAYFNPVFWRLAALGGLDYRPVVIGDATAGPIGEDRTRNKDDLAVDVVAVMEALRKS